MSAIEGVRLAETPDRDGAFPRLSEEQIARLAEHGERRHVAPGDVLYREGDLNYDFFVILSGKVASIEGYGKENEVVAVHGPGRFLGELSLLTGEAALVSAVVQEPGEVLAIPAERLRALVSQDPALGDMILRACFLRRSWLIGVGAGFRIIGSRFSPDTRRLREFAARNRLPHRWIDLEQDRTAEAVLRQLGVKPEETPVVIVGTDRVLRNPSNAELAEAVGLRPPTPTEAVCDLLVVGAGPAGLGASVYGASEGLATTAVDAVATGGQAATSSRIENYLGFPAGISGAELADRAAIQARKFGARITVPAAATALRREDGHYVVPLDDGTAVAAETVVIATGARYCKLPVPRLEEFEGTSVFYAATLMEAQMCVGDPIAVVGGGNSAGQATLFLSQHAAAVRLLIRSGDLGRDMSRYLADRIERNPKVEVMPNTEVRELVGEDALEALVVEDNRTGERRTIEARALFVFIGAEPHTDWLGDAVALDRRGFVLTGRDAAAHAPEGHEPMLLETSLPGVLAVGDVRSGSIKRVASAVGEGAMAVRLVHEHLNGNDSQLER
ncbi:MAG: Thioredoxin-disulfide reductase [Solirubrobacterales bacterium]|nr:Thioredoxin-disulfide reductase [Solirubrobacterales bacterium]